MKTLSWILFVLITVGIAGYYGYTIVEADDKSAILIGEASHGHFQIELACSSCHTEAFGGQDLLQDACEGCHQDELDAAHDSHPKKKFNDPRNVDTLEIIDARYCVSCHTEHQNEQSNAMGVTLPDDYCFHCHVDIADDRESHADLPFDSCASAGCHNFHDNRALYESFLVKNANGPWLNDVYNLVAPNHASTYAHAKVKASTQFSQKSAEYPQITEQLAHSAHGEANVQCASCHTGDDQQWLDKPGVAQCQTCHETEATSFGEGKHGMRLAAGLGAISPADSKLAFSADSLNDHQGCNSCHAAHETNTTFAAVEACVGCHADEHSRSFADSPHAALTGESTVTCATCHMPTIEHEKFGETTMTVQHNQNDNLRPNEKMIRPVCMQCHSLGFSIDALADEDLIKRNFNGQPAEHIPSIDWALKREAED